MCGAPDETQGSLGGVWELMITGNQSARKIWGLSFIGGRVPK